MTTIAISQPLYLPAMVLFNKAVDVDIFVLLDHVQYLKGGFQNRNKVKNPNGPQWVTVPVLLKGNSYPRINEVKIDNKQKWAGKHWRAIKACYENSDYFKDYSGFFEMLYKKEFNLLRDLDEEIIRYLMKQFEIKVKIARSSDFNPEGQKNELVINICRYFNADTYVSGIGAKAYMDDSLFAKAGIKVEYQNFVHPMYKQLFGKFEENMSAIDILFNEGEKSKEIIREAS